MQRKYNLAYFIIASIVGLGFMSLMISVDAQAQIAFASNREGNFEIYVMDTDGKNPRRLTDNPALDWHPSWSPNGKRIVFSSEKGDSGWDIDIYVIDADGGNLRKLTNNRLIDNYPSWSPDGEHIAFASERDGNLDIYVMDTDGKNLRRLTKNLGNAWNPSWSPNGERIAFTSNGNGNNDIYVMNANGKIPQNLTGKFFEQDVTPAWFHRKPFVVHVSEADELIAPAGRTLTMWGWLKRIGQ